MLLFVGGEKEEKGALHELGGEPRSALRRLIKDTLRVKKGGGENAFASADAGGRVRGCLRQGREGERVVTGAIQSAGRGMVRCCHEKKVLRRYA